ncbi:MAG: methyltransferase domain-containing protein [Desulfarculus sp.]|nr:methyltransferase domain-containing protein [Desulfarculus sp.]
MPLEKPLPSARPGQGAQSTAAFYDQVAPVYDQQFAHPPAYTFQQARWLARVCPPGPLLDLGCGSGRMLGPLSEAGFAPVAGLDCSPSMLGLARRACPDAPLVLADASQGLPLRSASFASIVSLHSSLIHLTRPGDPPRLLAEALRVLRPGGLLVLELPHPHSYPPEAAPGRWRDFSEGIRCRRVEHGLEELRLDELGGLTTRVRLWELDDLRRWFQGWARVEVHPGFAGGRFDPRQGSIMVVVAGKGRG